MRLSSFLPLVLCGAFLAVPTAGLAAEIASVKGIEIGKAYDIHGLVIASSSDVRCDATEDVRLEHLYWRFRQVDSCFIETTYLGYKVRMEVYRTKTSVVTEVLVTGFPRDAYTQIHQFFTERLGEPIPPTPPRDGDYSLPGSRAMWQANPRTKVHVSDWQGTKLRFWLSPATVELDPKDI